jgi:hypothetical protein
LAGADLSDDALSVVSIRLKTLILADNFLDWSELSSPTLTALFMFGLPFITNAAVECRLADFVLRQFSSDSSFGSVLAFFDFSQLSSHQIKSFFQLILFNDETFGRNNFRTVMDFLVEVDHRLTSLKKTLLAKLTENAKPKNEDGIVTLSLEIFEREMDVVRSTIERSKLEIERDL